MDWGDEIEHREHMVFLSGLGVVDHEKVFS